MRTITRGCSPQLCTVQFPLRRSFDFCYVEDVLYRRLGPAAILGSCLFASGCVGVRLMIAPTIDTQRNVGVEARVNAEFDFFYVHVGAGGGGGLAYAQRASAWQVGGGGSVPLDGDTGAHWLDFDLQYSGYLLHAVQDVNPEASPYAHGIRLGSTYRGRVTGSSDRRLFVGPGFFGEASFREGQTLGIFGLPLCLHLFREPKLNFSNFFR